MKKIWMGIVVALFACGAAQATVLTFTGMNNCTNELQGTSSEGDVALTEFAIHGTSGANNMQYTITGLDLNGVGGADDSVVVNIMVDPKRNTLRTSLTTPMFSDGGAYLNSVTEGLDFWFDSIVVNLDGGTNNGTGSFGGFTGVNLNLFDTAGESTLVNGTTYTSTGTSMYPVSLDSDDAISVLWQAGSFQVASFDFQIEFIPAATLITVSGADNHLVLADQEGTSDLGTLAQTLAAAHGTTGWQPLQYTITGLDLNGVGETNDSVVVNLQVDAKRVDLRTGLGPFSDAGSTCNGSGEGIDVEFVSMAVNLDGGTNNGFGTFEGFTGVTLGEFLTGETATVNGALYTAQDTNSNERIALANDAAIDHAYASGNGSRIDSFDFQVAVTPEPTQSVMLELASMFSDDMILQREKAVPVWGTSDPGAAITVEFAGQTKTTTAASNGTWRVDLDSMAASEVSRSLTVTAELEGFETEAVSFSNVLVGEVWLCSGQSNMWWPISNTIHKTAVAETPTDPLLRFFELPTISTNIALERLDAVWTESTTGTSGTAYNFSGVAYYFGLNLKAELGVPVGLIQSAIGGTEVEKWLPAGNDYNGTAGDCYNGMVDAIIPFAMRGVIWYQGEANVISDGYAEPMPYVEKKKALINGWRSLWGEDFPFYYVQIAPYLYTLKGYTTSDILAYFWEAQAAILDEIPDTGMAVITDSVTDYTKTNLGQVHPKNKEVPGYRLALLALDNTYGQDIVSTGPVFQSLETVGNTLQVSFDSADGLTTSDGLAPDWFELQVADGVYTSATAVVSNNMVILSSPAVTVPTGMRFGWSEVAQPNLRNSDGLVPSAFRFTSAFHQWTASFGLSNSNTLHNADPDGDALDNLGEYAFGGNPTNGSDRGVAPAIRVSEKNGANCFEYVYARRCDAEQAGLVYRLEAASNLVSGVWSTDGVVETGTSFVDADYEKVTNSVADSDTVFVRLTVEQ